MADNVELPSGSGGATIRTDDDGSAQWQYVKLAYGADNTQNIVTSTTTNALPVALSDTDNAVLDTIDAVLDTINAKLVSGTVIGDVNLGATDNAVLDSIATNTTGLNSCVSGSELQVDIVSGNVTNAGTFAVQVDGAALTALQLIDNTVYVDDADWTALTSSHNLIGGIYQSSPGSITDGDTGPIRLDANGAVHINDGGNSITVDNSGLTELAAAINSSRVDVNIAANDLNSSTIQDDGAFTLASSYLTAVGGIRDDSLTTLTAIEGDAVPLRVNSTGALHVTGGGGGTEYTADATAPASPTGATMMMERDDALGGLTPVEGDWTHPFSNARGALWVELDTTNAVPITDNAGSITVDNAALSVTGGGAEATALRVTIANDSTGVVSIDDNSGSITVDNSGTFATQVDGAALTALQLIDNPIVAHDAAASGSTGVNMAGGYATNNIEGITQVANADAARVVTDLNGVLVSRPHTTLEEVLSERVSNTGGTATAFSTFAAGGSGIHNYVTTIVGANSSATNGTVDIYDGTTTSVLMTVPLPANGGAIIDLPVPIKGSDNTALGYDVSGALSTVYLTLVGYQAKG